MEVFSTKQLNAANLLRGAGNPEGVVSAAPGSLFQKTAGGRHTIFAKRSGTGSTGWASLTSTQDCVFSQYLRQTVANTAAKTSLLGGPSKGSSSVGVVDLQVGTQVVVDILGEYSALAGSDFLLDVAFGTTEVSLASGTLGAATGKPFCARVVFVVRNTSPGDLFCFGQLHNPNVFATLSTTPTFSAPFALGVAVTWNTASPSNSLSVDTLSMSLVLP